MSVFHCSRNKIYKNLRWAWFEVGTLNSTVSIVTNVATGAEGTRVALYVHVVGSELNYE